MGGLNLKPSSFDPSVSLSKKETNIMFKCRARHPAALCALTKYGGISLVSLSIIAPCLAIIYLAKQRIVKGTILKLLMILTIADLWTSSLWLLFPGDTNFESPFWMAYQPLLASAPDEGEIGLKDLNGIYFIDIFLFAFLSLIGTSFGLVGFYISRLKGSSLHISTYKISLACALLSLFWTILHVLLILHRAEYQVLIILFVVFCSLNFFLVVSAHISTFFALRRSNSSRKSDSPTRLMMRVCNALTISNIITWIPVLSLHVPFIYFTRQGSTKEEYVAWSNSLSFFVLAMSFNFSVTGRGLIHSLALCLSIYFGRETKILKSVAPKAQNKCAGDSLPQSFTSFPNTSHMEVTTLELSRIPSIPSIEWDFTRASSISSDSYREKDHKPSTQVGSSHDLLDLKMNDSALLELESYGWHSRFSNQSFSGHFDAMTEPRSSLEEISGLKDCNSEL